MITKRCSNFYLKEKFFSKFVMLESFMLFDLVIVMVHINRHLFFHLNWVHMKHQSKITNITWIRRHKSQLNSFLAWFTFTDTNSCIEIWSHQTFLLRSNILESRYGSLSKYGFKSVVVKIYNRWFLFFSLPVI